MNSREHMHLPHAKRGKQELIYYTITVWTGMFDNHMMSFWGWTLVHPLFLYKTIVAWFTHTIKCGEGMNFRLRGFVLFKTLPICRWPQWVVWAKGIYSLSFTFWAVLHNWCISTTLPFYHSFWRQWHGVEQSPPLVMAGEVLLREGPSLVLLVYWCYFCRVLSSL